MLDYLEVPYQVDNPTDQDRYDQIKYLLNASGRIEDFNNIIELLNPPPDITTICPKGCAKDIKVAVIGAGEAGLAAAFELRKTGCDITVFESSSRIGGRIYTHYFDRDKKYLGELGAMRISSTHQSTWHYINLFKVHTSPFVTNNINGLLYLRDRRAINDPGGISVMRNIYPAYNLPMSERRTPWNELNGRILKKYLHPLPPDIRREIIEIKPVYSRQIEEADMLNHRMAYESVGLSQQAISMLGYLATFEQTFFKLSLMEILQEAYTADFSFTYRINEGMITLPNALYTALCSKTSAVYGNVSDEELGKVNFKIGFTVDGIYKAPAGEGIILEYSESSTFSHEYEYFDYVICSIPFTSLRRVNINPLFSVLKMQAINELNYEVSQKTYLFMKNRFWEMWAPSRRIVGGSTSTDLPVVSVFYPSDHALPIPGIFNGWTLRPGASPYEPGVMTASYNWSQDAERLGSEYEELRIYDVKKYIEKIHSLPPGYMDENLLSYKSLKWSNAQYIWTGACLSKPEDKILFSYVITLPEMDGRVFFAGEHISQKHAWQQGALQTGMIAANGVAERIRYKKS